MTPKGRMVRHELRPLELVPESVLAALRAEFAAADSDLVELRSDVQAMQDELILLEDVAERERGAARWDSWRAEDNFKRNLRLGTKEVRAERDALAERVRLLEAALTEIAERAKLLTFAMREARGGFVDERGDWLTTVEVTLPQVEAAIAGADVALAALADREQT